MEASIKKGNPPRDKDTQTIYGGNDSNPTWKEYLSQFRPVWKPFITAIREALEREGLIGTTGEEFCNNHYFQLNNQAQTKVCFTWRAFGDLMQAIVGKREGYIRYYM